MLYTLDKRLVLLFPFDRTDSQRLVSKYVSNMFKHLGACEVLYLMPQVEIFLINEVFLLYDIIFKQTIHVLKIGMILKVGFNELIFLFSIKVILQVNDGLYEILTVIHSEVVLGYE